MARNRILKGKQWRGKDISIRRYFYGVKILVLTKAKALWVNSDLYPAVKLMFKH